jgi:hypothetical protein
MDSSEVPKAITIVITMTASMRLKGGTVTIRTITA